MVYDKVTAMIASQMKVDQDSIGRDTTLLEQLHADSADVMMLIMDLEQEFDVMVEDDALMSIKTVGDIVDYLEARVK